MKHQGLFVGLTTLDFIYLSDRYPQANQKVVAQDYVTAAGGPATNAAIAFNHFGNQGKLLTVLGQHPLSNLIKSDLSNYALDLIDLMPEKLDIPAVSSIIVTATTGERSVISLNAAKSQANPLQIPEDILSEIDIILVDGHQIEVSLALATIAKQKRIPVVVDAGSWKPGLEQILTYVDYAICSANFSPPQCHDCQDVFNFMQAMGITQVAITQGEKPVKYLEPGKISTIPVPKIKAVDTLGAGDIFHGAFCHYILQDSFAGALGQAIQTASRSCQFFGTRSWLEFG